MALNPTSPIPTSPVPRGTAMDAELAAAKAVMRDDFAPVSPSVTLGGVPHVERVKEGPHTVEAFAAPLTSAGLFRAWADTLPDLTPAATVPVPKSSVVGEAIALVDDGDRNQLYGDPSDTFGMIAQAWTAALRGKLAPDRWITAEDVGILMVMFKCIRYQRSASRDSLVDIVGYVRTTERVVEGLR